ncbi:dienelactone hydrolase family protein [Plastoroseomonas arctica]|uniref:Dienelactone hydrolase family protein n=1 Tax=Plastoroseomonas arctica TaxID=1509237 RepID=A0AAF1K2A4_9PROT|nr:dienelactone hydrolase family protein [Plastoroseomonas arctica]MBR0655074.1 dienelactone hydrolase family protein [Plastoroseomonas arctica]
MRGLILAMLLLSGCAAEAQGPITLGAGDMMIPGPEGVQLRARLVPVEDGRRGVPVLAFHGCGGIGGPERGIRLPSRERDWADRLHALGHPVLFVDSFGSRGRTEACRGGSVGIEAETIRRADAHAAAAWAAAQPWAAPGGVVLLGWSHGGSTVTAAAAGSPPGLIRGVIGFYPGCYRLRQVGGWQPNVPMIMLLGAEDDWTPARHCEALAARDPARVRVQVFPGAHHGFDAPTGEVRQMTGLAFTARGGGVATIGPNPAAREAVHAIVPAFIAGLAPAP